MAVHSNTLIGCDPGLYEDIVVLTATEDVTSGRALGHTREYEHELPTTITRVGERNEWDILRFTDDTLWLQPERDTAVPIEDLKGELEEFTSHSYEKALGFGWVAVVPDDATTTESAIAYFGRLTNGQGFLYNGIECVDDTTLPGIASMQRELIRVLGETKDPEAVCWALQHQTELIREGGLLANDVILFQQSLLDAAVSVLSPLGWRAPDIEEFLADETPPERTAVTPDRA